MKNITKNSFFYVLAFMLLGSTFQAQAQTNNDCSGAISIDEAFGGSDEVTLSVGPFDNTNATANDGVDVPICFPDATLDNTLWFSFEGDGGLYFIETSDCNGDLIDTYIESGDTQIQIYTGECGSLVADATGCNEDGPSSTTVLYPAGLNFQTTAGTTYYVLVDGFAGSAGEFCIEATKISAIGCENASAGTLTVNDNIICGGDTLTLTIDGAVIPNGNPFAGFTWAISYEDISGSTTNPADDPSYWGSFGVNSESFDAAIANTGNPLGYDIYYFTPVVVGNADNSAGNFLHQVAVDSLCLFVGQSIRVELRNDDCEPFASVSCDDPNVSAGTGIVNLTDVCVGETLVLDVEGALAPTDGLNSGFTWLLSNDDISNVPDPSGLVVGFLGSANDAQQFTFAHDEDPFPAGTYFFTPFSYGNAENGATGSFFDLVFDPACTHVGTSIQVNLLESTDPICGCPQITFEPVSCFGGFYSISYTVTDLGDYTEFTVTDGFNTQVVTEPGVYAFPASYLENTETILSIVTADGGCDQEEVFSGICPAACNVVNDPSFELNDGSWSATFALCNQDCGADLALEGDFWLWFGGLADGSADTTTQSVTIPVGSAELSFFLFAPGEVSNGNNTLVVQVDGSEVFGITDTDATPYADGYVKVTVDIAEFADGNEHAVSFIGTTVELYSFHVDYVQIDACGPTCDATAGTVTATGTATGFTATATGQQTGSGFTYYYIATDAGVGNIVAINTTGTFTLEGGSYDVYGLSIESASTAGIEATTTLTELNALLGLGICAELSSATTIITTGINGPTTYADFAISQVTPIPATDVITVNFDLLKNATIQANVYSVTGKLMSTQSLTTQTGVNTFKVVVTDYPTGMYFITLVDGERTVSAKFVKK